MLTAPACSQMLHKVLMLSVDVTAALLQVTTEVFSVDAVVFC